MNVSESMQVPGGPNNTRRQATTRCRQTVQLAAAFRQQSPLLRRHVVAYKWLTTGDVGLGVWTTAPEVDDNLTPSKAT